MNQSPDKQRIPTHLKNLARWIVLVPVVLLILFGCGQFALVSAQQPSVEGPLTKMQADYRAWSFTEFQPLTAGIMDEILKDRSRYAYGAPPLHCSDFGTRVAHSTGRARGNPAPAGTHSTVYSHPGSNAGCSKYGNYSCPPPAQPRSSGFPTLPQISRRRKTREHRRQPVQPLLHRPLLHQHRYGHQHRHRNHGSNSSPAE